MTRLAPWILAAVMLAVPAGARADGPRADEEALLGRAHTQEHAKIWKAQDEARARWDRMTPAERRDARRAHRRAMRQEYARAQAAADTPGDVGSWDPPFVMTSDYEGYAIHAAMLHTGKVLMWGYPIHTDSPAFRGNESYAWLWDPSKGTGRDAVESVEPIGADGKNVSIYCSGMSFLPDGRVLVVGGNLAWPDDDPNDEYTEFVGLDRALLFDPVTEEWTDLPRPALEPGVFNGRWYPTQVLLPNGDTFVISGLTDEAPGGDVNEMHEIYEPPSDAHPLGRFTLLDAPAQLRKTELYPHLFVMPDGNVLLAGPNVPSAENGTNDSAIFNPNALDDPWTELPPLASQRIGGTAVLLPEGPAGSSQVALIGGRPYDELPPAMNEMIDLDDASPSWRAFPGLNMPRSYPNTVLLPDRSMVTLGGDDRIANDANKAERTVEIYNPETGTWRVGPAQVETRAYHSTAMLLPDGRILSAGDDFNPTSDGERTGSSPFDTGEIYSPPYLFDARGERIPAEDRPSIAAAPTAVRWDVPFAVETQDETDDAVLAAPAAVTHANDMNQRIVPLRIVKRHAGAGLTLRTPQSANVAPPGWYMLFLLRDGVPSVARWIRLDGAAADGPAEPADRFKPTLELAAPKRALRPLRRKGRLPVRITVDEPAKVALTLHRGKRRVAGARTRIRRPGQTRRVRMKVSRKTRDWLQQARAPRLRLKAVALDAAGNRSRQKLKLRR